MTSEKVQHYRSFTQSDEEGERTVFPDAVEIIKLFNQASQRLKKPTFTQPHM